MINVILDIPERIKKVGRFKFKIKGKFDDHCDILGKKMEGRYQQRHLTAVILAKITALDILACEVSVVVRVDQGSSQVEGTISAYDPESKRIADKAILDLPLLVERFANSYPESSFYISYSQVVEITLSGTEVTLH